ncbi:MAG TPA: hypothetical protein VFN67_40110 [Polyangiales bacterium]|nr:hypothetical protein [Polyangiales bacterium]
MTRLKETLCFTAFALATACSDADTTEVKEHAGSDPLYLAVTRIWNDSETTSYLHVVPSLDKGTEVDPKQARELAGPAKLFSYGQDHWFAVGGGEEPTITRYTLDKRGKLVEGDSINLQPFGVQDLWDTLYFVSDTQAYYPDTTNSQLIRWNPTTMQVDKTIALPETARKGFVSYYGLTALERGDKLLFSVSWFDWNETDSIQPETGLVEFDTEKDELSKFEVDSRCGGITQAIELKSGDAYFVSSALAAATYRLERLETEPCALRVKKGQSSFDKDYLTHLRDLTGGALAGEPVLAGDNALFLRVLDESDLEIEKGALTWNLTGKAAWKWSRWDLDADELTAVDDLPASTADTFWFHIDGHVYASETNYLDDEATAVKDTTLIDLTAQGGPERELTLPGFLQNIARVR